jgi:potassium voltage-gated channel Eag-related subfamily H protein 8
MYSHFFPALSVNGVTVTAQNEVADELSSYFETASSSANYAPTFLLTKVREECRYLNFTMRVAEPYNSPFSIDEFLSALKRTRDTSPGPDAIHNQMLRQLPPSALSFILIMYNRIWIEGSFPSRWGEATVVPILKAGKDRSISTSYRPIYLTSYVCKLLERMVNSRLGWILESRGLLSNIQCGFRRNRS